MMSPLHNNPELLSLMHTDRVRKLRQDSRVRRPRLGADDRRWG